MQEIKDYVNGLKLGNAQTYQNMTVIPLKGTDSGLDYFTLDEALEKGLSVKETGSVPKLHFTNNTGKEVLMLLGEYIVGGGQNRMLTTNVYMDKNFKGDVPVNCVQAGRWNPGAAAPNFYTKKRSVPSSIKYLASRGQGEVWKGVECFSASMNARSASNDLDEIIDKGKENVNIDEYTSKFSYETGSVGMIVVSKINGKKSFAVDIFDQSRTMQKNFDKLVESYALDAANRGLAVDINEQELHDILDNVNKCNFQTRTPVSLGADYKMNREGMEGFAISHEGQPLYITFSSQSEKNGNPIYAQGGQNIQFRTGISRGFGNYRGNTNTGEFTIRHTMHRMPTDLPQYPGPMDFPEILPEEPGAVIEEDNHDLYM